MNRTQKKNQFMRLLASWMPRIFILVVKKKARQFPRSTSARLSQYCRGKIQQRRQIPKEKYRIGANAERKTDVSVIITNYNYSRFVQDAILSVEQNCKRSNESLKIELIVVDDCSTDNSVEIIRKALTAITTPSIFLRSPRNVGVSMARNLGILQATGEYIFVLDADNKIFDNTLENLHREIVQREAIAAYGKIKVVAINAEKELGTLSNRPFDMTSIIEKNYIDVMALYRADALMELGGFDEKLLLYGWNKEDWEVWISLGKMNRPIAFFEAFTGVYTTKDDSLLSFAQGTITESSNYIRTKHRL